MGLSHVTLDFSLRGQGRYRVDNHNIHGAGADYHVADLEGLLAGIRLRQIEIVDVYAELPRVLRIKGVLRVNEEAVLSLLLGLGNHLKRKGGLS